MHLKHNLEQGLFVFLSRAIVFSILWAATCASATEATNQKVLPIEHFTKSSDYLDLVISPDGKYYAARVLDNDRVVLLVYSAADLKVVGSAVPGAQDEINRVSWVSNDRLIYSLAQKEIYRDKAVDKGELFGMNYDGTRHEILAGFRASDKKLGSRLGEKESDRASHYLLNRLPEDEKHVLIIEFPWSKRAGGWYDDRLRSPIVSKLNVFNGRKKAGEGIPFKDADVYANDRGEINFLTWTNEFGFLKASYRKAKGEPWQDISDSFDGSLSGLYVVGINTAGTKVYLKGRTKGFSASSIYEFDLNTQTLTRLFENELDIVSWINNHKQEPMIGLSYPSGVNYHFAVNQLEYSEVKRFRSLFKQFPGVTFRVVSQTHDGTKSVLELTDFNNPGEFYIFDQDNKKMDFFAANQPWLTPDQLVKGQVVQLQARDGVSLNGYITFPPAASDENPMPMVVLLNRGQHGDRDYPFFNWQVQLLANQGYSVLQVNVRGSAGYTHSYKLLGNNEWGKAMVDDVIDATQWAVKNHPIDSERICIYGELHGGFVGMRAASKAPELYQCAIGSYGTYDLPSLMSSNQASSFSGGQEYFKRVFNGASEASLQQQSPINHVDKISAAVFLIRGEDSSRTLYKQTRAMRKAFQSVNKKVRVLEVDDTNWRPASTESRTTVAENVLDFLNTHIGNK